MYRHFTRWLFDGSNTSPIPEEQEMLKYNSSITLQYMLLCLLPNPKMTIYMNKYFNNFNLYSLNKKQFLHYIKHLVLKLNLSQKDFNYKPKRDDAKSKLYNKLLNKLPEFKSYDISLLCDTIDNLPEKERNKYYASFDLLKPTKRKLRKKTVKKSKKISLNSFIGEYFNYIN